MKHFLSITFFILLLCCPWSFVSAQNSFDISIEDPSEVLNPHRAPKHSPIEATYYYPTSSIVFTFSCDLGDMDIEIDNISTGEHVSAFVNTTYEPFTIVCISGDKGTYVIRLNGSGGKTYHASFVL